MAASQRLPTPRQLDRSASCRLARKKSNLGQLVGYRVIRLREPIHCFIKSDQLDRRLHQDPIHIEPVHVKAHDSLTPVSVELDSLAVRIHGSVHDHNPRQVTISREHLVPANRLILVEEMSEIGLFVGGFRQFAIATSQPSNISNQRGRKMIEDASKG